MNCEEEINELYYQHKIDKDIKQLKRMFAQAYINLQEAWMKQDLALAPQLSDKLRRDLNKLLSSLKRNNVVDYIKDIEFTSIQLLKVSKLKDQSIVIRVRLSGTMIDERIPLQKLASITNNSFRKKKFSDLMEFSYHPYSGWQAVYLEV